jgi:hypothetical protein
LDDLGIEVAEGDRNTEPSCAQSTSSADLAFVTCAVCNAPMRLFENVGVWICNRSPRCPGDRSGGSVESVVDAGARDRQPLPLDLNCPICDSPMVVTGILRRQIACPNIGCGFTLEPRLSSGILRILARRQAV